MHTSLFLNVLNTDVLFSAPSHADGMERKKSTSSHQSSTRSLREESRVSVIGITLRSAETEFWFLVFLSQPITAVLLLIVWFARSLDDGAQWRIRPPFQACSLTQVCGGIKIKRLCLVQLAMYKSYKEVKLIQQCNNLIPAM